MAAFIFYILFAASLISLSVIMLKHSYNGSDFSEKAKIAILTLIISTAVFGSLTIYETVNSTPDENIYIR